MCCAVSLVTSHHPHYFFRAVDNTTHVLVPPLSSSLLEKLGRTLPVKGRHRKTVIVHANSNVRRNPNIAKLQAGYLFPEINRIKMKHLEENPDAKIISLGIGDTTEPIPQPITKAMAAAADNLGTSDGYATYGGYGAEQGQALLREKLAAVREEYIAPRAHGRTFWPPRRASGSCGQRPQALLGVVG